MQYVILVGAVFITCMAVIFLLAARLSEDKEAGILKQMWRTYFGGDERDYPTVDHPFWKNHQIMDDETAANSENTTTEIDQDE
jgi:hypothetical protein